MFANLSYFVDWNYKNKNKTIIIIIKACLWEKKNIKSSTSYTVLKVLDMRLDSELFESLGR